MNTECIAVQKAAAAIVRLINEKPITPTVEEVEALVGTAYASAMLRSKAAAPLGSFEPTISSIAAALPGLYDLRAKMGDSELLQVAREDTLHGKPPETRPKFHNFEGIQGRAHQQVEALESLMFLLEPENAT